MKKTILATTILFAGAVGLLAQGVVNFDNGYWNYDNSIELGARGTRALRNWKASRASQKQR
jgi:hypothetical protein